MEKVTLSKGTLAFFRRKKNLTQAQVAEKIGVTAATYCGYETGKYSINMPRLYDIAQLLDVDVSELVSIENNFADEDPIRITFVCTRDLKARLATYAEANKTNITDAIIKALQLALDPGSDFDKKLHSSVKLGEIYSEQRKVMGLKPLKSAQLKADLFALLNDNDIGDIITALKELQK